MNSNILEFFPHNDFREFQQETIIKIQKAFDKGKEYVVLESPTGSGKSAIGICVGLYYKSAFLLTSQKILQDQYSEDYCSNRVRLMKGRNNYDCVAFPNTKCDDSFCSIKPCDMKSECLYEVAKQKAIISHIALMNYKYFLCTMNYTTTFSTRTLLICDEAHNIDNECMSFVEFNFSSLYLSKLGLTSKIPLYEKTEQYKEWLESILIKIKKLKTDLQEKIKNKNFQESEIIDFQKELESLVSQEEKINAFLASYEKVEWIFSISFNEKTNSKTIEFKPLTIGYFAEKLIFTHCEKKLLMSATILNNESFCKNLGIDLNNVEFIKVDSTFPKEIRPMYLTRSGNLGKNDIDNTLPKIITDLKKILEYHNDEKGLVHVHTYKISNYIQNNIGEDYSNRLIFHESLTRDENLKKFIEDKKNKVLITPSMTEGVDLKDDLARFIVIVKLPFLYLGDKQIKRKSEIDPDWYSWKTALSLVQAAGRGVRHKNDFCTIYVMDSQFEYFLKKNRKFLPKYFIEAIAN
jgi:ATP-dependent DNA helicase DinG